VPLKRRAAPRAELMVWDGSKWQKALAESAVNPNLRVSIWRGTDEALVYPRNVDGMSAANDVLHSIACKAGFNGSAWDRWRNNTEETVLPSAARKTSGSSADQTNFNARGVIIWLYISAVSGSYAAGEGLEIQLQGKDPTTGAYLFISPTIGPYTTIGHRQLLIYPGATDSAGLIEGENDIPLPRVWRINYRISGTDPSFTFSVGASYIV